MEFPPACEVRVNNMQLQANLKGLKKKPGTTPPPDLGRLVKMSPGATNRLDMIYVNSQQPVHGKVRWLPFSELRELNNDHQKYYITVMLVEVTSTEELIDRLKKGKSVSKEDVLAESEFYGLIAYHPVPTLRIQGSRVWPMTTKSLPGYRKCHSNVR
jgi:E3 SUMO-protein ligase PIAS1